MTRRLVFIIAICFVLTGCTRCTPEPNAFPPPKPDPAVEATDYARRIVSDPSNWKGNTALLTDLGARAQDLGIIDSHEFREFDAAAQDLIRFGTIWVTSSDEGSLTRLRDDLSHITDLAPLMRTGRSAGLLVF